MNNRDLPFIVCAYDLVMLDCYYENKDRVGTQELYVLSDYLKQKFAENDRKIAVFYNEKYIKELNEHPSLLFKVENDVISIDKRELKPYMVELEMNSRPSDLFLLDEVMREYLAEQKQKIGDDGKNV